MSGLTDNYLKTFQQKDKLLVSFLSDLLSASLIVFLLYSFNSLLNYSSRSITGGRTVDELKVALVSGTIDNASQMLTNVKIFFFLATFGLVAVLLVILLIFSFSRAYLWYKLNGKKFSQKYFWRWNGAVIVLFLLFLPYYLIYGITKIMFGSINFSNENIPYLINQIVNYLFLVVFLLFTFLVYYFFTHRYKVWGSIGDAFQSIKKYWSPLWKMFLIALLTGLVLSLISYFIIKSLVYQPSWITTLFRGFVLILYISWLRVYLFDTIRREHDHPGSGHHQAIPDEKEIKDDLKII